MGDVWFRMTGRGGRRDRVGRIARAGGACALVRSGYVRCSCWVVGGVGAAWRGWFDLVDGLGSARERMRGMIAGVDTQSLVLLL